MLHRDSLQRRFLILGRHSHGVAEFAVSNCFAILVQIEILRGFDKLIQQLSAYLSIEDKSVDEIACGLSKLFSQIRLIECLLERERIDTPRM